MFIAILLTTPQIIFSSSIDDLKQARIDLVAGKKQITDGKQGLKDSYFKTKHDVIEPLTSAAKDLEDSIGELKKQRTICNTINNGLKEI